MANMCPNFYPNLCYEKFRDRHVVMRRLVWHKGQKSVSAPVLDIVEEALAS